MTGRATCAVCHREYALRTDGTVRYHSRNQPGHQWSRATCPGSRQESARPGRANHTATTTTETTP